MEPSKDPGRKQGSLWDDNSPPILNSPGTGRVIKDTPLESFDELDPDTKFNLLIPQLKPLKLLFQEVLSQGCSGPTVILVDRSITLMPETNFHQLNDRMPPRREWSYAYRWLIDNLCPLSESGLTGIGGLFLNEEITGLKSAASVRLTAGKALLRDLKLELLGKIEQHSEFSHILRSPLITTEERAEYLLNQIKLLTPNDKVIVFVNPMQLRDFIWSFGHDIPLKPLRYQLSKLQKDREFEGRIVTMRYLNDSQFFDGQSSEVVRDRKACANISVSEALKAYVRSSAANRHDTYLIAASHKAFLPRNPNSYEQSEWPHKIPSDYIIIGGEVNVS